jgi:HTH-type transcriptional regulator / antitoxin HigA
MKNIQETTPKFATHPGAMLLDEIEASEYSQTDFASLIGYNKSQLNEIIKGKRNINAELAILLEKALKIDADFWLEAQKNYDLDKARIEEKNKLQLEAIEIWNVAKAFIPALFYKKEKVISGNPIQDNQTIRDIYGVANLDQLAMLSVQNNYARFKKSTKLKTDVVNIMGWVKLVQHRAKLITVVPFNHESKDKIIIDLRKVFLENNNVLNRVQEILHNNGIKLVFQIKGEKTPVDGVSFWSNGNPAIGMTLRHKRLDNFAFTLFHELGHIYEHLINNNEAEFIDLEIKNEADDYKNSPEEKEANYFAQNGLITEKDWKQYKDETFYLNNDDAIIAFAKKIKINPCIIRGRVCFETNDYRSFSAISHIIN